MFYLESVAMMTISNTLPLLESLAHETKNA